MDTRKITLIATIAVIALVAVGVGYAYTASTINQGNNADSEYVTLTQTGTGKYTFTPTNTHIYYDTVNTAENTTTYKLTATTTYKETENDYTLVHVGNQFTVVASQVKGTYEDMTCTIAPSTGATFDVDKGWIIFIKTVNNGTTKWFQYSDETDDSVDNPTWSANMTFTIKATGNPASAYATTTVDVYYGYAGTTGLTTAPSEDPLAGASLTFSIDRNAKVNPA